MDNVTFWIKLENLLIAICCIVAFQSSNGSWTMFAILFLAPDLFMLGYRINNRIGAYIYNVVHHYAGPLALGLLAWSMDQTLLFHLALIWLSHISVDRVFGFGLKFNDDFKHTHLQIEQSQ